ncbi:MAG: redoxin domain-containing protein [Pseudomonadota bacterium]
MKLRYLIATFILALTSIGLCQAAVQIGQPAPMFTGTSMTGKQISLKQYKDKIVVLEWTNYQCPFVKKMYDSGKMEQLKSDYTGKGVVWLTVVSSAPGKQGYVTAQQAQKIYKDDKASAVILDPSGDIGKLYNAKTTPEIFIINKKGKLVYMGAIDSIPSTKVTDVAKANNYVETALNELLAGKAIAQAQTTPYGCSVKYH